MSLPASPPCADPQAEALTYQDLVALARADFWVFIELTFPVLHPGQQLVFAEYLEVMATLLMRAAEGQRRRLIFNLPPRFMKSMLVSVLYVAWRLGRDPTAKFICISYGDDLAHDLSATTRKLMLSRPYARIFPKTVLEKKAVDHITTTQGGRRYATAVGSDITGFGADEIIIDDPMQPDEAASELAKQKVRSWVQSSVLTRFNDPAKGILMLVMHRLAPDDLSATLEATGPYFTLKLPLIAEKRDHFYDRHGRTLMLRQPGEVLNPSRMSPADVEALKASLAPHVFAAQYQQRPTAGGSGMLSIERFRRDRREAAPVRIPDPQLGHRSDHRRQRECVHQVGGRAGQQAWLRALSDGCAAAAAGAAGRPRGDQGRGPRRPPGAHHPG